MQNERNESEVESSKSVTYDAGQGTWECASSGQVKKVVQKGGGKQLSCFVQKTSGFTTKIPYPGKSSVPQKPGHLVTHWQMTENDSQIGNMENFLDLDKSISKIVGGEKPDFLMHSFSCIMHSRKQSKKYQN